MPPPKYDKKAKKQQFIMNLYKLLSKHKQIVIVTLENVGSTQIQQIRRTISNAGGLLVIGKNTIIRKAVHLRCNPLPEGEYYDQFRSFGKPIEELNSLIPLLKDKVGFVFTDQPVFELKPKIEANRVQAAARVGIISPLNISIPPGPTGMDPSQISFFHALSISTKIQKGQIEISKEFQVCYEGKKIGSSEVALLAKMNLKPFNYGMNVIGCYDDGAILSKDVVAISPNDIIERFQKGVKNLTALSMEAGIPTELSIPHSIINAFKNLAAIGLSVGYEFKELKSAVASGPVVAAQPEGKKDQTKPSKKEAPVKVEEPEPEPEEDMDMGGLFD